jgi:hypothetical protein
MKEELRKYRVRVEDSADEVIVLAKDKQDAAYQAVSTLEWKIATKAAVVEFEGHFDGSFTQMVYGINANPF